MKQYTTLISGALIAISLSLTDCSGHHTAPIEDNKAPAIAVVMGTPAQAMTGGVMASGQVEAVNTAAISTRLMGTITHIYVNVGDQVRQGQLLVAISSEDLLAKKAQADAQIAGAQADLDNATKDYDRYNALFNRQSATASELDNATLRFHAAQSRLQGAQQMRREVDASAAYARLTAPFAGVVTQKIMDEGSMAAPGAPILVLEQNGQLQVSANIAESDIIRIKAGDKADLTIRSIGLTSTGPITQISVSSAATGGQYQIKIALPQSIRKSLYAGMYVNVFVPAATSRPQGPVGGIDEKAVYVPASALVENDQLTGIYTVSNRHTALLRWVRTGKRAGDKVEILSGLNTDEPFIVSAESRLYNGAPVTEK